MSYGGQSGCSHQEHSSFYRGSGRVEVHARRRPLGLCEPRVPAGIGYMPRIGVWSSEGRYRPLLLESLAQALGGQHLPLADLTRRFVHSDRSAVYKQGPSLLRGSW
jgi:hypothetical protein